MLATETFVKLCSIVVNGRTGIWTSSASGSGPARTRLSSRLNQVIKWALEVWGTSSKDESNMFHGHNLTDKARGYESQIFGAFNFMRE